MLLGQIPLEHGQTISARSFVYDPKNPEKSVSALFRKPLPTDPEGSHRYLRTDAGENLGSSINIYTDNPRETRNPLSPERSTLNHEMAHRDQALRRLEDNPTNQDMVRNKPSKAFSRLRPNSRISNTGVIDSIRSDANYWIGNRQEINARGVEGGLLAQEQQNQNARARVARDPAIQNYEVDLEISKGTAPAPELRNVEARARSAGVDAMKSVLGSERKINASQKLNIFSLGKASDMTKLVRGADKAYRAVASDVGRAVMANEPHAAEVMRDAYSEKVTGPQRERASRVARTQADVERTKSARMAGGLGSGAFSSDPISISNLAMDVAGAMGDSSLRSDQVRKAAASLYNPFYSDSEQMMGDALLRGGGEEFQVDPTFLRVAAQRDKDRKK